MTMGMISITLQDVEYQGLQNDLACLQLKEMKDQKWYPKEKEEIKAKIKSRYGLLKDNYIKHGTVL